MLIPRITTMTPEFKIFRRNEFLEKEHAEFKQNMRFNLLAPARKETIYFISIIPNPREFGLCYLLYYSIKLKKDKQAGLLCRLLSTFSILEMLSTSIFSQHLPTSNKI